VTKLGQTFRKWDSNQSPGFAVGVFRNGGTANASTNRVFGTADLDHDVPITPSSVFHVASMSKQFTAAAVVLLAEGGELTLDDDVRKYI
jgi:CubicO group peptidase (beta-lactamase class C family)